MKKRMCLLLMCATTLMCGCTKEDLKIIKPLQQSEYVDSYVNAIKAERYEIKGQVTLEKGDYVVYPYTGQECMIDDGEIGQVFEARDFIRISEAIDVNISNGYVLPLDKAPAMNGEIVTDGVYLVGFDTLPEINKMGTNSMVVVSEEIPELFEKPAKENYAKFTEFEAKDGMLVKIDDTPIVSRPSWDVQGRVSNFYNDYVNTAIENIEASDDIDNLMYNLWCMYLISSKYSAMESTGTIVILKSPSESIDFKYGDTEYKVARDCIYTITNNPDKITTIGDTTKNTKVYKDFKGTIEGGQVYILGDIYTAQAYKDISQFADSNTDVTYIKSGNSEEMTGEVSTLEDGYLLMSNNTNTVYTGLDAVHLNIAEAIRDTEHIDTEITLASGEAIPNQYCKYGCYKIKSGSVSGNEPSFSLESSASSEDSLDFTLGDDYVLLYKDGPTFTAEEDTALVGIPYDDVIDYWLEYTDAGNSVRPNRHTTQEVVDNRHEKTYTLEPDKVYEIGKTMSANTYTMKEPIDITVYPYSTQRAREYKGCRALVLQSGDKISVTEPCILNAKVTDDMEENERLALAIEEGKLIKEYHLEKEGIAGKNIPAEELRVLSDVEVTVKRNEEKVGTYGEGNTFTPEAGDVISVSEACDFQAQELPSCNVNENVYEVFSKSLNCPVDVPIGTFTVVGGNLTVTDTEGVETEYNIGDTLELKDGYTLSKDWYILTKEGGDT